MGPEFGVQGSEFGVRRSEFDPEPRTLNSSSPFDPHALLRQADPGDWGSVFAEIDLLAREARWSDLASLRAAAGERRQPAMAALRHRIENLAAADPAGARALAQWLAAEPPDPVRAGDLADRLAQAHPWPAIAAAGFRDDLLLRAAHARVLRREDLHAEPVAWRAHADPLGTLPLSPLPLERTALLPHLTPSGSTWSLPFGPHVEGLQPLVPGDSELAPTRLDPASLPAFSFWKRRIAATGVPAGLASPADAAAAFAALLPETTVDAVTVRGREIDAPDAWSWLLCGALTGDAGERRCAAEGRLAAWATLATLAGAPWPEDPTVVERAVAGSRWFIFAIESQWFGSGAREAAIAGLFKSHWCALAATERE